MYGVVWDCVVGLSISLVQSVSLLEYHVLTERSRRSVKEQVCSGRGMRQRKRQPLRQTVVASDKRQQAASVTYPGNGSPFAGGGKNIRTSDWCHRPVTIFAASMCFLHGPIADVCLCLFYYIPSMEIILSWNARVCSVLLEISLAGNANYIITLIIMAGVHPTRNLKIKIISFPLERLGGLILKELIFNFFHFYTVAKVRILLTLGS